MPADTTRTYGTHVVALLLTSAAAAAGYLSGSLAAAAIVLVLTAAGCGWSGGLRTGSTAAAVATLLLPLLFENAREPLAIIVFGIAAFIGASTGSASRRHSIYTPPLEWLAAAAGLPLLVAIVYLNLSDVVARRTPIPSLLQPLILVLLIAVLVYRRKFQPRSIAATPVALFSIVYCIVLFARSAWVSDIAAADERIVETVRGIVLLLIAGALGVSWTVMRRSLAAFALGGALVASLTLIQAVTGRFDIDFGGLARSEIGTIYASVADVRAGGPVGDPNFYGQILVMAFPIAAFLGWSELRTGRRILYLGAAAIIAAGAVLTYSRGALLALALVALLTVVLLRIRIFHVAVVALLVALLAPTNLTRRVLTLGPSDAIEGVHRDSSLDRRLLDAATAATMFGDRPLIGMGTGSFSHFYGTYADRVGSPAPQYDALEAKQVPHSLYLEIAAENGLLGLVSFGALIVAAFLMLKRARYELMMLGRPDLALLAAGLALALIGYLASSLFLHGAFQRYLWILLGLNLLSACGAEKSGDVLEGLTEANVALDLRIDGYEADLVPVA